MNEKETITSIVGIASLVGALGVGGIALWKYLPVFLSRLRDTETANVASAKVSETAKNMLETMQKQFDSLQQQIETLNTRIKNKDDIILTLETNLAALGSQALDMKVRMSDPHLAESNKRLQAEVERLREALAAAELKIAEMHTQIAAYKNDYIPISGD